MQFDRRGVHPQLNDVMSAVLMILIAAVIAAVVSFVVWGAGRLVRRRSQTNIRRRERVSLSSDVNTDLRGYTAQDNRWGWLIGGVLLALWIWMTLSHPIVLGMGGLILGLLAGRDYYKKWQWGQMQSYWLTDRGVWYWPAREGRPFWKGKHSEFYAWKSVDGYKIDGGFVHFYRGGQVLIQVEYEPREYDKVKAALLGLGVKRLEVSDRIWVAQFDEEAFYELEEEISMVGWRVLEMFQDDLIERNLIPEFGVMRNMPGNRLLDEHSRSWLQLNLLDIDSEERRASSMFPLWQSNGTIGYLIGVRGQELMESLQQWMLAVCDEVQEMEEGVVS